MLRSRDALLELGAKGGPMDPGDDLSDPITLITDPAKSANNPNNPTITAGFTFLGQFLDHDMTFDPTSSLARQQDPESIRNFRIAQWATAIFDAIERPRNVIMHSGTLSPPDIPRIGTNLRDWIVQVGTSA